VVTTSREIGMQSMDVELGRLVNEGVITVEDGYAKANDKRAFEQLTGLESSDKSGGTKPAGPEPQGKPTGRLSMHEPQSKAG
jgi:Tfp pilus assembly ATPase PilU